MTNRRTDPLKTYNRKRDFAKTAEPAGTYDKLSWGEGNGFMVQKHDARRLHFDFRLELDRTLKSWAGPNGPSLNPADKRLAVRTEDHPLSYATFEGSIPKGEYGGGGVTVWDAGSYVLEKWTDREVKVVLSGRRVSGRYVFFRTRGSDWMVHRMDGPPDGWTPLPKDLTPMLATTGVMPLKQEAWAFEVKWDGVRALVWVDGGRLTLRSRNGNDITSSYPELRGLGLAMGSTQALLDGEIVAMTPEGRS